MQQTDINYSRLFYKWHRILGLVALVPIICWTLSGLSHPLMSNWFRPFIPLETYQLQTQNTLKPALTLQQVLDKNYITVFRNYGVVSLNKQTYYQILQKDSTYNYYSATDGKLLPNGDRNYAIYLARYFTMDSISKISSAILQTTFDGQYQPTNHLLPVWKISLERSDGMDIYIETGQSRMGTFNNNTRKTLLGIFEQLHTWDFMAKIFGDKFRLIMMLCIVMILFLSLLSGIIVYGLFWSKFKAIALKHRTNNKDYKRFTHRYHRQTGLIMSFLMLMFFTSAGFHLLVKLHNISLTQKQYEQLINRDDLKITNLNLPLSDSLIKKQSLVKINGQINYQISDNKKIIHYYNAGNGTELKDGDRYFAQYLTNFYQPNPNNRYGKAFIIKVGQVRQFTNEYGFVNKRLPVQQVSYRGGDNWYIETTTQKLAAHIAGIDRTEGLSFIFLHKFFWITWAGKDIRDVVSMLAALSVLLVALLGFTAFIKHR